MRLRKKVVLIFLGLVASVITLIYHVENYKNQDSIVQQFVPIPTTPTPKAELFGINYIVPKKQGKNKLILFWTPGWDYRQQPFQGWDVDKTLTNCPFSCDFTDDKNLLSASDAIIYHGVHSHVKLPERTDRSFGQIWTFLTVESPATVRQWNLQLYEFDNQFNWTATYRMDSDVPRLYFVFKPYETNDPKMRERKFPFPIPTIDSMRNKSLVGWMHSNCNATSLRVQLVEGLQKYVPVDIFGKCSKHGRIECPEHRQGWPGCYRTLSQRYKFWLALENSLCPDYVTEKFYFPLLNGMVPIVYAHKSVPRLLPENSYINIWDFETMEELAKYLIHLDQNPLEYLKYFDWRKDLWVGEHADESWWCSFCTKLSTQDISIEANRKYYKSIHEWYFNNYTDQPLCLEPSGSLFNTSDMLG